MTLQEAIDKIDGLKPNQYSAEDKIGWLSQLDMTIFRDIIMTHHHPRQTKLFMGYTSEDLDHSLIAEEPYTELYIAYLGMKIDEYNNETQRYNNSATMFNAYYENYEKWINKTRMPIRSTYIKMW